MADRLSKKVRKNLLAGALVPIQPLIVGPDGAVDVQTQRAVTRYHRDAGAGGIAVGAASVPLGDLYRPWLETAAEALNGGPKLLRSPLLRIAVVSGSTAIAVDQARIAADLGYHLVLADLGEVSGSANKQKDRFDAIAEFLPVFAATRASASHPVSYAVWRDLCESGRLAAIQLGGPLRADTLEPARAVRDSGLDRSIPLYTGNEGTAYHDLVTRFAFTANKDEPRIQVVGGVLRSWGCWTRRALDHFDEAKRLVDKQLPISRQHIEIANQMGDIATVTLGRAPGLGRIAGVLHVLRSQGFVDSIRTIDREDTLSRAQVDDIERIYRDYPHLYDDAFVQTHLEGWFS